MGPAAILSVLVKADTGTATAQLSRYDRQLAAVDSKARRGIKTRLEGSYNPQAFTRYQEALTRASDRAKNRAAFRAELGANFNNTAFNQYQRALEKSNREAETASARTHRFSGALGGLATGLVGTGAAMAGVSLGLGVIATKSVEAASKFQQGMEQIHTQAGASQAEVTKLSAAVLKLSTTTATAPTTLVTGLYHLESQGLRGAKAMDALRVAAEGAKVGNANLEDVTNGLGSAVVSGIKGVSNLKQAMGALNAIVGSGDMRMQDLANALGTGILGPMKEFGVSLKDVGAALAVFGDNNIRGADAGTKLASAIRIMAAPSKAAAKELGTIGIAATQLGDDIRKKGLVFAFEDLKKHLTDAGLTASQQARVLTLAFGGRQATGVQLLLGQLERLRQKEKQVGDGAGGFGKAWQATRGTLAAELSQIGASFQSLGIAIGRALAPLVPIVVKVVSAVALFVTQMETGQGAGGKFVQILVSAWGTLRQAAVTVFPVVRAIVVAAFDAVMATAHALIDAFNWVKGAVHTLHPVFAAMFPVIAAIVKTAFGAIKIQIEIVVAAFKIALGIIVPIVRTGFNYIKALVNNVVIPAFQAIKWVIENVGVPAFNLLQGPIKGLGKVISGVFNTAKTVVGKVMDFILGAFSTFLHGAGGVFDVASHIPVIGGAFKGMADAANNAGDQIDALRRQLKGLPAKVSTSVGVNVDFFSNIAGAITSIAQAVGHVGVQLAGSPSSQAGHHFSGGVVKTPGYFAGEEAPQHPEVILATNPKYRQRNISLFAQAGKMLGVPGFAAGGLSNAAGIVREVDPWTAQHAAAWVKPQASSWAKKIVGSMTPAGGGGTPFLHGKFVFPLPQGSWTAGRVDQGWDLSAAGHTPEYAIAAGKIIGHGISGFGPWAPILELDSGGSVYYGHAGPGNWKPTGTRVQAGQVISEVGAGIVGLSTGPHLEIGFYPPGGMGAGAAMKSALGYRKGGIFGGARGFAQGGIVGEGAFRKMYHRTWDRLGALHALPEGATKPILRFVDTSPLSLDRPYTRGHTIFWPKASVDAALHPGARWAYGRNLAKQNMVHETAHTLQSASVLGNVRLREGGAQAWTDQFAPKVFENYSWVGDAPYSAYVAYVRKNRGWGWIDAGQFGASKVGRRAAAASIPGFAAGGIFGPVSTFGPPGEAAHSTALAGHSSSEAGISLRIPGTSFDDPRNRALMGQMFRVSVGNHTAVLRDIDLGPNQWTGRNIDITGAGARAMGLNPLAFPTGAVGRAFPVASNVTHKITTSGGGAITGSSGGGSKSPNTSWSTRAGDPSALSVLVGSLAGIPSQGTGAQIKYTSLNNSLTSAQNAGNVGAQQRILGRILKLEKGWLTVDKAKLKKINKALQRRGLSKKQRGQLIQDKLNLLQEIGTVEGDIGSTTTTLTDLSSAPSDATGAAGGGATGSTGTDPVQALIDATNAQTQEMAALRASLDAQTMYMKSVGEIEKRQAIKALSDVISGQIGGNFLSRSTGSAGDGSVARYGSVSRA